MMAAALLEETDDIIGAFHEWQQALVASSMKIRYRLYLLPGVDNLFFALSRSMSGMASNVVTISDNEDFNPAIVKINVPKNAQTTNGLSHVLAESGAKMIIRQGRLHHNPSNLQNILPKQFEAVCDADPIFQSQQAEQDPRNWFLVCRLGQSSTEICAQTVAFAIMCREVRQALGSGLIDQSQKITAAAIQIADMKVWAQRS